MKNLALAVGIVLMCVAIIVEEWFVPDVPPIGGHRT